jgi:serine/threonine-protein kinase
LEVGRSDLTKLLTGAGEGERLDRFELIAELASGGMATVFLARLSGVAGFQRLVAIKRLHPHLAREREFVDMFLDEARLAARIHHPNVVPIQEIGQSERGYYLVMDYIEGDTAARLFARSAQSGTCLPIEVGIRILLDALAGLHAAHELKDDNGKPLEIVHRDVSPQNILVGIDGTSRLTDFGVARAATRLATTRSGQLKGKLAYMAPEQARGGALDRRADVFAMGIVAWEALAFRRLFKGEGEAETLNRVLYEPIPTLISAAPQIPPSLNEVVMKALERDADKRFATASDFADALEQAARALQKVGTTREVATFLESMVGTDISQQREAVRTWLARSEPSRNENANSLREQAAARDPTSVTRIEAGKASRSDSISAPGGDSAMSSVSGASFQVPGQSGRAVSATPPSTTMRSFPPPGQQSSNVGVIVAVVAVAVFLLIAAGGGIAAYTMRGRVNVTLNPPPSAETAATTTVAPVPSADPAAPPKDTGGAALGSAGGASSAGAQPADVASDVATSAPPASAATSKGPPSAKKGPARPPAVTTGKAGGDKAPTGAPSSATMPDDISHNPYR